MISYDGFMVQGMEKYGKTYWFDVGGTANNKYVEEQGEFLLHKLKEMIDKNPKISDKKEKDVVYVITPFSNVAYQLSQKLRKIHFTRYDEQGKPTNVGTVHTFQGKAEDSWVGIPLWVHRRCRYPMFTISNMISYDGFMVQGMERYGKTDWFDVGGTANNKYVEEQGEFLLHKLKEMIDKNPKISDKREKDVVYVITPFANVAYQLSQKLRKIHFTRYDEQGKPTNVGTVHTFQGKEAPIVFFVLGADRQSSGAARWAVTEANIMNVAATRAKEEFYIIGDRKLYLGLGCDVATDTERIIREYKNQYLDLVDDHVHKNGLRMQAGETRTLVIEADFRRITGTVKYVGKGKESFYAYVVGADGKEYSITENTYSKTENAIEVLQKGKKISFIPGEGNKKLFATEVKMDVPK